MKSSFRLALAYLINQKGRSLALVTSVSIAVILIFTLNVIPETQSKLNIKQAYINFSDYHVEYSNLNKEISDNLKNDKEVKEIHDVVNMGNIVDKNGVSINLNSYSEEFVDAYGYKMIKGSYPKNENEIVLEEKALREMNLDNKLGQNIDFNVIKKYIDESKENQIYSKSKSFKLVGIVQKPDGYYEDNIYYQVKGFTVYSKEQDIIPTELITHSGVLKFYTSTPSMVKANKIMQKYNLNDKDFMINVSLREVIEDYNMSKDTNFSKNNKLIPMAAAILVIYNIFNIILIDMTNQIGMLRAVGMSKKYIRFMIFIQSMIVLIIGLIIGFTFGGITSYLGLRSIYGDATELYISKESVLEPLKLAVLAVTISSVFSIYKAGKISPIEAIRSNNNNTKQRDRRYYKYIRKVLGITGEMAYKNVWRNKTRTILSVLSISLAATLFISKMVIFNEDKDNLGGSSMQVLAMGETDIILKHNENNSDENFSSYNQNYIDEISKIKDIKSVVPSINLSGYLYTNKDMVSEDLLPFATSMGKEENMEVSMDFIGYNSDFLESLDKYIESGSNIYDINKEEYPSALISNNFYSIYKGTNDAKALKDINIGDVIEVKIPIQNHGKVQYKNQKVKVKGLLNKDYVVTQDGGLGSYFQVILNEDDFKDITSIDEYNKMSMQVRSGSKKEVNDKLEDIIKSNSFKEIESKYKYENYFSEQAVKNKKEVLVSVVITLLISSINIICIIKTNIMLRVKEISTLRAIGMSMKKIKSMIVKESLVYAILSIFVSAIVSAFDYFKYVTRVNSTMSQGLGLENTMTYAIPVNEILQVGFVTIFIFLLATYLSKNKILKLSIVDGLRVNE